MFKQTTGELVNVIRALSEKRHQQQVIYNISTSIFLLRSIEDIVRNTISEIVIMYHWSNVAYFPYGGKKLKSDFYGQPPKYSAEEVFKALDQGGSCNLKKDDGGEYTNIFLVGRPDKPLGVLYVGKTGSALTDDQAAFFKTVASFLTIAIDNILILRE